MNTIQVKRGQTRMIAHRGVSGLERENTCAAFLAAGNRSYFGIETDVHVSGDGQYVIIHDETTKRVTLDQWDLDVEKEPYAKVGDLVLPDLDGSMVRRDLRIPLLGEYLSICKKYEKTAVLELKNHMEPEEVMGLIQEVKKVDFLESMIFISFDLENCLCLRQALPMAKIQWLLGNVALTEDHVKILTENHLDLDIYYPRLTQEWVEKLHALGVEVNCWTCDDLEKAEMLISWGVDYLTSNCLE